VGKTLEEKRQENQIHKVTMNNREKFSATGIEDVESLDDDKIIAYTVDGQMTIRGAQLRINRLSLDDGVLEIEGLIDGLEYSDNHRSSGGGIWGKIFK
jgi:sporulation protein YabP